jgi:enamine deaminase RidA (YjgF/YER057c/UK114 family)
MPQQFGGAMPKEHLNPRELPNWAETFSQIIVARTTAARLIWVSGQVAVDADNRVVGPGDLAQQAEYAFRNLSMALEAAGASLDDVVRLGIYVKNLRHEDGAVIRKALRRVFVRDALPTSTWLGVTSLALDELLIEVEATAVIE